MARNSISPQRVVDNLVPLCPLCGTEHPDWLVEEKRWRYIATCTKCGCKMAASRADVTGVNKSLRTISGILKRLRGKKIGVIYSKLSDGNEYTLDELNRMGSEKHT